MGSLQSTMYEFRVQLQKGIIQQAYKGLMDYMWSLKSYFNGRHPEYSSTGTMYHGYMDMTYIPLFPESLKRRNLKIAIVFNFERFRFEVWLSATNKTVQAEYWKLFKESGWSKYLLINLGKGVDSILEHVLVQEPDFDDLDSLTATIERETIDFIENIEKFVINNKN